RTGARLSSLLCHGHGGVPPRPSPLPRGHRARGRRRRGESSGRVIRATTPTEERLIGLVADAVRGPARQGLFALWLVVRSAEALLPERHAYIYKARCTDAHIRLDAQTHRRTDVQTHRRTGEARHDEPAVPEASVPAPFPVPRVPRRAGGSAASGRGAERHHPHGL